MSAFVGGSTSVFLTESFESFKFVLFLKNKEGGKIKNFCALNFIYALSTRQKESYSAEECPELMWKYRSTEILCKQSIEEQNMAYSHRKT